MPLQSILFRDDAKLKAAEVSDPAHITPGQRGEHVAKIQMALNVLDSANLNADGSYGPRTADAVLAYKRKRNVVNPSYQAKADNIVGRMTIAAMDRELLAFEAERPLRLRDLNGKPSGHSPPSRSLTNARFAKVGFQSVQAPPAISVVRHAPNTTGTVTCENTLFISNAVCTNLNDPAYDPPKSMENAESPSKGRATFLSDLNAPIPSKNGRPIDDGGSVPLTTEPSVMRLECLHPGDAVISASRVGQTRLLFISVRQAKRGIVDGEPLTKLAPGSDFFSDPAASEGKDPEGFFGGRPVNPKRGGRMINLGGAGETPEFEDYQVDLRHSFDTNVGFRPWTDDPDPAVFIPDKSASHITLRGVPLDPTKSNFVKVIKRIAGSKCRLTFSGDRSNEAIIRSQIPGHQLEDPLRRGTSIEIAWEIA
jgi:peptidoglycan hydrolase-like protein with peptidoglycan-binding domain